MDKYYKRRNELIAMLGGKCVDCGTTEALEFDHRDASTKSFELSRQIVGGRMSVLIEEAKKCDLRCTPCHHAKSSREGDNGSVPHGGGISGKKNCPCEPCKARKREYMREWKQRRKLRTQGM